MRILKTTFTFIFIPLIVASWSVNTLAKPQRWRATWWGDPSTTMVIGWDQPEGGSAKLVYRERSPSRDRLPSSHVVSVNVPTQEAIDSGEAYWAQLTGLKPETEYEFKVGIPIKSEELIDAQSDLYHWSEPKWFRTAPNRPKRLTFIAGGDSRNHRAVRQVANRVVAELDVTAVLFGGDFTARDTTRQWREWLDDWQLSIDSTGRLTPLVPTRGNHDSEAQLGRMWGRAHPHFYYALTFGDDLLRLYTLNSERPAGGDQKIWLTRDLKRHQHVRLRWAQYHKPMRPHTQHKSEGEDEYQHWAKVFDHYHIDIAIECDSHLMKITYPLRPTSRGAEGFMKVNSGTTYLGEGGWGAPLRRADDLKPWTLASDRVNHLFFIEVDANGGQRVTPLRILSQRDRAQLTQPYPWLKIRGLPREFTQLTQAVPLMLPRDSAQRSPRGSLNIGYQPLVLLPRAQSLPQP